MLAGCLQHTPPPDKVLQSCRIPSVEGKSKAPSPTGDTTSWLCIFAFKLLLIGFILSLSSLLDLTGSSDLAHANSFPVNPRSCLQLRFKAPGRRVCCGRENEPRESWVTATLPQQALCCGVWLTDQPGTQGLPLCESPASSLFTSL